MKKLELNHVVGYLPWGLRIVCNTEEEQKLEEIYISIIKGVHLEGIDDIDGNNWDLNVKPILRPLSELTKEIEVNGEKFVPIKWLKNNYTDHKLKLDGSCIILSDSYSLEQDVLGAPFAIIEKLYEWHFDIHELIEKGLAIDINTLTK